MNHRLRFAKNSKLYPFRECLEILSKDYLEYVSFLESLLWRLDSRGRVEGKGRWGRGGKKIAILTRENDSKELKQWQGAGTTRSRDILEVESTRLGDQLDARGKEEDGL